MRNGFIAALILAACSPAVPGEERDQTGKWPAVVEKALVLADRHRPELEKVLDHFHKGTDRQKFEAACFLIRNMPGHGHVIFGLFDSGGKEIDYDALQYPNLETARAQLEKLEKAHGPLRFRHKQMIADLKTLTAEYLIENIERAFKVWRERPWAKNLSFEAFCEHILPYRGSEEPAEAWRAACELETKDVAAKMKDPADPREAAAVIQGLTRQRVHFKDLYYLHPTDQGFKEMCAKRLGRCEDVTNMQLYVYRANGIAAASDYTPFWANRDNNHAWEVILDRDGKGKAGLSNVAAKVYRKTYAHNPDNLIFHRKEGEAMPGWLSGRSYRDVTDQYTVTMNVTVELPYKPELPQQVAYICVFNGGQWQPIHWGHVRDGRATFDRMARGIAYLVGYYVDRKVVPAAPPFILDGEGKIIHLAPNVAQLEKIQLPGIIPRGKEEPKEGPPGTGQNGELFYWDRGWKLLGRCTAEKPEPALFQQLPADGLFWIVTGNNRSTARIFTAEKGKQRSW